MQRPEPRTQRRSNGNGRSGFFLTLEGVEGAGKSTRCHNLILALRNEGYDVVHTREPGGPPIAERIRELLLDPEYAVAPLVELMLYLAARAANVHSIIIPALEAGKIVVCERFSDATVAYQVWGRGLPEAAVRKANDLATDGLVPDLTVLLDLDPEEGFRRLDRQQRTLDRIEAEMLDFHRRVRQGYLELSKTEPRFYTINASLPENQQDRLVLEHIIRLLMDNEGGREG